jgi:serine/threonine protein kinase
MAAEKRFEHYEVLEREDGSLWELGRGAMGVTYKAFDTDLHCMVALKVINPVILNTEGTEQRFLREARAAAQLRHPNIATVLRLGKTEDATHFYAMEFCEGRTLEQFVADEGALSVDLALNLTLQVTKALIVAEEHHVVHRDIKPSNLIVVTQRGEGLVVKVIDFGLAKSITSTGNSWTSMSLATAGFIGTAHFSSPEQLEEGKVDVRSDIYSLGATLWFMLTARPMFSGSVAKVMSQHLSTPPPWEELNSLGLSAPVNDLLRSMLEKDPDKRPQTALELKQSIESCREDGRSEKRVPVEVSSSLNVTADVLADRWKLLEEHRSFRRNIYRAVDLRDGGKIVGVTLLDRSLADDPVAWSRLQHAVDALQQFAAGVVRPFNLERNRDSRPFLVTEWINGVELVTVLRRRGALSWKEVLLLLEQLVPVYDRAVKENLDLGTFCKEEVLLAFDDKFQVESRAGELAQKSLNEWPEMRVVINLLPLQTDDLSANQTFLSMATMLPGATTASQDLQRPRARDLALFIYELLGGSARPSAQRYVPIARIGAAANEFLKTILSGQPDDHNVITGAEFLAQLNAGADSAAVPTLSVPAIPRIERATSIAGSTSLVEPVPAPQPERPQSKKSEKASKLYRMVAIAAAVVFVVGLLSFAAIKWKSHSKVSITNNSTLAPAQTAPTPPLEGELLSSEHSPKGDIRVEYRSGGWIYLIAQTAAAKHYLLQKSTALITNVVFSPDENWLVVNERAQTNDSSSRLYHRVRPDDMEYREDDGTPLDKSLTDAGWKFYVQQAGLPDGTTRNEVGMSGVEWKSDSTGLKLRFDATGTDGQKILPQRYVCVYDVMARKFASETDVNAIRSAFSTPSPTERPWKAQIGDFIAAFIRVNQSDDANAVVNAYAPRVDYFDQGRIDQSAIRTDVEKYNSRWPTRHDEIENNNIAYQEIQPPADYLASFNLLFFAASPARLECVKGRMAVTLHVSLTDGPKITAIQQKVLQREKGILQISGTGFTPVWGSAKQQVARPGQRANPRQTPGNQNQPNPAAAEIFNSILNGLSGGRVPIVKPHRP